MYDIYMPLKWIRSASLKEPSGKAEHKESSKTYTVLTANHLMPLSAIIIT